MKAYNSYSEGNFEMFTDVLASGEHISLYNATVQGLTCINNDFDHDCNAIITSCII